MQIANILVFAVAVMSGEVVSAAPIRWNLSNIVFGDGTIATGGFTFDASTNTFSELTLTTSGGSSVPATSAWVFNTNNPEELSNDNFSVGFAAVDGLSTDEVGTPVVALYSINGPLMTDAGGTITLNQFRAATCGDPTCNVFDITKPFSNSGSGQFVSASVPEPMTWILSGSVLLLAAAVVKLRSWRSTY